MAEKNAQTRTVVDVHDDYKDAEEAPKELIDADIPRESSGCDAATPADSDEEAVRE